MNPVAKHASIAARGLIAAASFVGALAILYTWAAPWIVWIADHWREIADGCWGGFLGRRLLKDG